jgi:hypothetical protein
MATAMKVKHDLGALAAEVAAGLASAEFWQGKAYIRTPVLLPTGSSVVVVVEEGGPGSWHLTDLGQGLELAIDLGIERGYRQQAEAMGAKGGLAFKGDTFLVQNLRRDQLAAGIAFIADAVAKSLDRARIAADGRKPADIEQLVARLGRLFEPRRVTKSAPIQGASTHEWRIDALVTTDGHTAAFDLVTPHANSVAATTTKFHDLARLDHPPARIAVVQSKKAMGDLLAVTAQAARVIEEGANDDTWRKAALAA